MEVFKAIFHSFKLPWARERISAKFMDSCGVLP